MEQLEVSEPAVKAPKSLATWSPAAKRMWQAVLTAPVNRYYEATDWQHAMLLCDLITEWDATRKITLLAEIRYFSGLLLLTEADRRRAHVEVVRQPSVPKVSGSDLARQALGLPPKDSVASPATASLGRGARGGVRR